MRGSPDWRAAHDLWFPPGLGDADAATHRRMFDRWFGGANAELPPFAPLIEAARLGRLDDWLATPRGRLSLILVLDQLPRGLLAGTPKPYARDPDALRIAEAGLRNGHYDALAAAWERTFFLLPLAHAGGPGHRERLERIVGMVEAIALDCPKHLRPLYRHSADQARGHAVPWRPARVRGRGRFGLDVHGSRRATGGGGQLRRVPGHAGARHRAAA